MKITWALITAGLTLGSNASQATAGQLGSDLIMGDGNIDVFLGATAGQNLSTGIHATYDERSRVLSIAGSERMKGSDLWLFAGTTPKTINAKTPGRKGSMAYQCFCSTST